VNLSNQYQRPLAGEISINLRYNSGLQKKSEYDFHEMRRIFYHEIIHALAFSVENFPYFIDEEGKQFPFCLLQPYLYSDNQVEFFIQHPKIKKVVQDFYNCKDPELNKGLPISKLDKLHFHQQLSMEDIIRPVSDSFDERISVFLLTLLEISGWYVIPDKFYYDHVHNNHLQSNFNNKKNIIHNYNSNQNNINNNVNKNNIANLDQNLNKQKII